MRCIAHLVALLSPLLSTTSHALFAEDASKLDFLIPTAGHGPVQFVFAVEDTVITAAENSCYVAGRSIQTGTMQWRRNVCTSSTTEIKVTVAGSVVITSDGAGVVRGWDVEDGALLWDRKVELANHQIWAMSKDSIDYVVLEIGKSVQILDAETGEILDHVSRKEAESSKPASTDHSTVSCQDLRISLEKGTLIVKRGDTTDATTNVGADRIYLIRCTDTTVSVLVTSNRGTTSQVTVLNDSAAIVWTQEEGLAQVNSALMLDASHKYIKADQESEILELRSRLKLQWKAATSLFSLKEERSNHVFGFIKIAVLLSDSSHRVYGVETVGAKRASIRYHVDLPVTALWHRIIHGSTNAATSAHGVNGGAHTRDILVLSYSEGVIDWVCIEGTSGEEHSSGSVSVASSVIQIMPLAGKEKCHQGALLLLKDLSLVSVTDDISLLDASGMYAHVFDKQIAGLKTFGISKSSKGNGLETHLVGSAAFPCEVIVAVAYPSRDELVHSPCDILGDDSLLLKYLSPHLAVVITMTTTDDSEADEEFNLKPKIKAMQKRKPLGVTKPGQDPTTVEEMPNLFVNLIDSVSGRIVYRASHANALADPRPSVLVSENWVFYSFTNSKTRKAELGVLSLYEGMIDKNGLTAFTSPEQSTSFSSLIARETKPVVLAKTFTVPKAVTSLGMTSTRSGISARWLLLASVDGQIYGVDRKFLEPRRPLGQLKEAEKKEGLLQYHELIQTVSYLSLSYNQTVESVRSIITAPTDLESQSLVLAFGGPDIFFARTSPSRGFDLLPDSFNKVLLSIVVVVLVGVLVVMQKMVSRKIQKEGWV